MNETVLLKLKVIVERAVRPVKASISRKKKMREELLAHVTGVFEDEMPRCSDETAALIQVEKRFGEPGELSRKLQESVSTIDRFGFLVGQLYKPQAGESLVRRARRFGVISFAIHLILTLPLVVIVYLFLAKSTVLDKGILGIVLASIAYGGVSFLVTLLSNGLQQTLFGVSGRSLSKGGLLVMLSCFVPVFLPLDIAVAVLPFLSVADGVNEGYAVLRAIWPAIILSPLAFVVLAKLISDEKRYVEEWARLQID